MTAADLLKQHSCEIVEDLLPFYAEHMPELPSATDNETEPSAFSAENTKIPAYLFVEEHIKYCENCRSLLEMITENCPETKLVPTNEPTIHFRKKYQVRLALGMAFAILTASGILALLL